MGLKLRPVSLINDDVVERNEEFVLALNVSLVDGRISPGDWDTAIGVITDRTSNLQVTSKMVCFIRYFLVVDISFVSEQFAGAESSGLIEVIVVMVEEHLLVLLV